MAQVEMLKEKATEIRKSIIKYVVYSYYSTYV